MLTVAASTSRVATASMKVFRDAAGVVASRVVQ
jgi:hypothetical protein